MLEQKYILSMFILTKVIGVCKDRFLKKVKINRKFLFIVMKISDVVKYKGFCR